MRIMDFLDKKAVTVSLQGKDKKAVLEEMVDLLLKSGAMSPKEKNGILKVLMEREELGSTGIGQGIGIPHGKSTSVKELVAALGIAKTGVDFESLDGEPVFIFFLLIAPAESAGPHLKALARISKLLKDKYFRDMLRNAPDEKTLVKIISDEDQKKQ